MEESEKIALETCGWKLAAWFGLISDILPEYLHKNLDKLMVKVHASELWIALEMKALVYIDISEGKHRNSKRQVIDNFLVNYGMY